MTVTLSDLMTTHNVPHRDIRESLGIVSAECVLGINVFRDLLGGIRDVVGSAAARTAGFTPACVDACRWFLMPRFASTHGRDIQ
jgi:uncharacterized protein YbjQ (UPF0145 family)